MYRKKDDLIQLVKSLSGAEKTYFMNFTKAFSKDGEPILYQQLFTVLQNPKSDLRATFYDRPKQSFTKTKKRLYQNILKCLRLYHQEMSVSIVIHNILSEVEILYNLSLADQSLFQLNKAYKMAVDHEKFGLLLQILEWESRLNVVLDKPTRSQEAIVEEEEQVLAKQKQFRTLENLYIKAKTFKRQYGFARGVLKKELENISIKSPGMPSLKECLSRKAEYYYHFIYTLYYWMTFQHEKAFIYSQKLVHPSVKSLPPGDYINGLLEHITSCVCLGHFDQALEGMRIGNHFIEEEKLTQSHAFTGRMFAYRGTYELIIYNYMGDRDKLTETISMVERQLPHYEQAITLESRHVITGNLMNAYMGAGNMKKADEIWDNVFRSQNQDMRREIFADFFLFRLFSLLQQKNYVLLPSAALSAIRFYQKDPDAQKQYSLELPIAQLLKKERDYNKKEVLHEVMETIQRQVEQFIKGLPGAITFQEHYSRYVIWCDAIMNEEPYYTAAARWYAGYSV